jgi:heme/copper-type cytochrome/quinol oxidase subunit 3
MTMLEAHADGGGHHEPAEVVAQRQLLGVWLFIAGDAVIVGSIVFTYLYLRGLNTEGQWMPHGMHAVSAVLTWGVVLVTLLSAGAVWVGERSTRQGTGGGVGAALAAAALALLAAAVGVVALRHIPQVVNASSGVRQVEGTYASSLLAIDGSNVIHLVLLALLGLGVAMRTAKGKISAAAPTHARLVRIFWVWVAFATTLSAVVTSPR